jgi:hypothetical protein
MNTIEKNIVDVLKCLKEEHGVFEIKAEFEAEGSRLEEMMRLKDVTSKLDLPIILKIGGVEAITDIYNALLIGVKGVIAPMAETPFAVSKFLNSIIEFVPEDNAEEIDFAINIETITAHQNLTKILDIPTINKLYGVTVGRVDLVGSMGGDRKMVNSDEILAICDDVFTQARAKGLACGLGGAISGESLSFIKHLADKKLIDKYETRKVVYDVDAIYANPEAGLMKGIEFELLWLKSKQRYYSRIKLEDQQRIDMLEKRLSKA